MLATHNSMTYLSPVQWWLRPFAFLWRCQDRTLTQQIKDGVRYFDIRISFDKNGEVLLSHGLVNFHADLYSVVEEIIKADGLYRLVLEKGDKYDERKFRDMVRKDMYFHAPQPPTQAIIKHGWKLIETLGWFISITDRSYVPFHSDVPWYKQWKSLFRLTTPKRYARKNNTISQSEIDSKNEAIFLDYYQYGKER